MKGLSGHMRCRHRRNFSGLIAYFIDLCVDFQNEGTQNAVACKPYGMNSTNRIMFESSVKYKTSANMLGRRPIVEEVQEKHDLHEPTNP